MNDSTKSLPPNKSQIGFNPDKARKSLSTSDSKNLPKEGLLKKKSRKPLVVRIKEPEEYFPEPMLNSGLSSTASIKALSRYYNLNEDCSMMSLKVLNVMFDPLTGLLPDLNVLLGEDDQRKENYRNSLLKVSAEPEKRGVWRKLKTVFGHHSY